MGATFAAHENSLAQLARDSRYRTLSPRRGVDFSSNDYLGLSHSPLLSDAARAALDRGVATGSGGSRLLRGNDPEHEKLEIMAAGFFGSERALFFSSGFAANATLFATLPQRRDLVVHDELIHASAHEGLKMCRAEHVAVAHNRADAFDRAVKHWRAAGGTGQAWLAVESLYSMDGDMAPLDDLMSIADAHDAVLLVDEAHATGVFGPDGRGLAAHLEGRANLITLRTLGKALGVEGALVCCPSVVADFLVNRGRGFIYSTAPSPLVAALAQASLSLMRGAPELRDVLWRRIRCAEVAFAPLGATVNGTHILPLIVGDDARAMLLARRIQDAGFDVRGIRPPTVPLGTARLRITITNNVSEGQIVELASLLTEILESVH